MTGPPVQSAKRMLKAKFSYAKALDDSEFFGWDLQAVLIEYQTRKGGLRTDGVLDYATQVALGTVVKRKSTLGTIFTVQGTGVDMNTGYPADLARELLGDWYWQPVGNYPAAAFPMGPSVQQGRAQLIMDIRNHPGRIVLAGYSQGAIVVSLVWLLDILPKDGVLHDRLGDVVAAITWGNPCRELAVANGNKFAGWPVPDGRGISDTRLTNTPAWWMDFAHGANSQWGRDIYTDTPNTAAGDDMTAIYRVVQNVSGIVGPGSLAVRVAAMLTNPMVEIPAAIQAIYFGGQFIAYNPPTLPHVNYDIAPAVDYMRSVTAQLRAAA
ncbi:gp53 protein [Mycobacteroides abscessus subsp. abscessus]|nr:gp53 protein [Mycobacteroides abscessus subsp. abscessus]